MGIANIITLAINSTLSKIVGLTTAEAKVAVSITEQLTEVVTSKMYSATSNIASSGGTETLDLHGALVDPLGDVVQFDKVMFIFIRNNSATGLKIGGATNAFALFDDAADEMLLAPGAYFMYTDENGIDVSAGVSDELKITGTFDDEYDILLIGS